MSFSVQKNLRQAEMHVKFKNYKKAKALYLEIIKKFPNNLKAIHALKIIDNLNINKSPAKLKNDQLEALTIHYNKQEFDIVTQKANKLLKIYPQEINIYNIKGASNAALHKFDEAIKCYKSILNIDTNSAIAYFNIAIMYDKKSCPEKSIDNYKKAIEKQPNYADAYNNLGTAYKKTGDVNNALEAYNKVVDLIPNHAFAHNNLGNIYLEQQLLGKAIESFKKAIFFNNRYTDAMNNLGRAYRRENRNTEAYQLFQKVISINPKHTNALVNIASLHEKKQDYKKSIPAYSKAHLSDPDNDVILAAKIYQQAYICDFDKIKNDIPKIKHAGTKRAQVRPLSLIPFDDDPERHKKRAEIYVKNTIIQNVDTDQTRPRSKPKRIRVGYVSSDFKNHPISHLIARVLEIHDRNCFELFGYSIETSRHDAMNRRIQKSFDTYSEFNRQSDKEIASIIKKDKIDILIDLNGHTKNARQGIFAYRPAKIQINFLGYPGTTGANYMDYIIADQVVIPNKSKFFYSENIIRLPYSYMPTDNTRKISNKIITRKEVGLPPKGIVFCCFNNSYKISSNEFDIWMRVLLKVGDSVLWLKVNNNLAKDNICNAAKVRGVDPSRIIFANNLPMDEHLARHILADIFLDTFNFNAHSTACDALWAGLPIITKIGQGFATRVASSLLTALDLEELITSSELEYENLILKLASKPKQIEIIKHKLGKNKISSPFFDTIKYTSILENAYVKIYENFFDGNKPVDLDILPIS